jgi:hypothetical protein
LSLEGVDDVCDNTLVALTVHGVLSLTKGGHGLSLRMLGVRDSIADDGFEEGLEDTASLFVDHSRDTLDTTTAGETSDGGLGDTLDLRDFVKNIFAIASMTRNSRCLSRFSDDVLRLPFQGLYHLCRL